MCCIFSFVRVCQLSTYHVCHICSNLLFNLTWGGVCCRFLVLSSTPAWLPMAHLEFTTPRQNAREFERECRSNCRVQAIGELKEPETQRPRWGTDNNFVVVGCSRVCVGLLLARVCFNCVY